MKLEELIEGQTYSTIIRNPGYIFIAKGNCKGIAYMNGNRFHNERPGQLTPDLVTSFGKYRPATPQEKEHLLQCVKAGKFVEYQEGLINKLKLNYFIL